MDKNTFTYIGYLIPSFFFFSCSQLNLRHYNDLKTTLKKSGKAKVSADPENKSVSFKEEDSLFSLVKSNDLNKLKKVLDISAYLINHPRNCSPKLRKDDFLKNFINAKDQDGYTALHHAVDLGEDIEILAALLACSHIDIDQVDNQGKTVLHWAVLCNNLKAVEKILQSTTLKLEMINAKDQDGYTALHYAVDLGKDIEILAALLGCSHVDINLW